MNRLHRARITASIALILIAVSSPSLRAQPEERPSAGEAQTLERLRAFAKLYGYVRFFHPSDEVAALDWDAFAVYGAGTVLEVPDDQALKSVLERLFLPVAPTLQLRAEGETSRPFAAPSNLVGLKPVAWQHLGVDLGGRGNIYRSIRTNRENRVVEGGGDPFGNLMRSIDAVPYRGKTVRLRARVSAEVEGQGSKGQLWLRVDREGKKTGFFDNMGNRPIVEREWRRYEITGPVAEDAERIAFGCFLFGDGVLLLDDFDLSVSDDGEHWGPVPLENAGFEQGKTNGVPTAWGARGEGYRFSTAAGEKDGNTCARIEKAVSVFTGTLFDAVPEPGERLEKVLGAGLRCMLPVSLYAGENGTQGSGSGSGFRNLVDTLASVDAGAEGVRSAAVRLADVVIAWNVFQHFYPYFDCIDTDWDAELSSSLLGALRDSEGSGHLNTLRRLVARLQDGHGNVWQVPPQPRAALPFLVDLVEGQVAVTAAPPGSDLQPGDVILSVDGRSAVDMIEEEMTLCSGSPQWRRFRALQSFGFGEPGSAAELVLRRGEDERRATAKRITDWYTLREFDRTIERIADGIWYVNLENTDMRAIRGALDTLARARGVVFDLRGYPNGNHEIISHLLTSADTSRAWMRIPRTIYPDRERSAGYQPAGWELPVAEPHIGGHVVFLVDGRAISYAESFMSFIEHYRLADIVGLPTAGANGNVNPFQLPGGFMVSWTGMRVVKHDGSQHHLVGIIPTVPVHRSLRALREGRDEFVEKAVELIRARK